MAAGRLPAANLVVGPRAAGGSAAGRSAVLMADRFVDLVRSCFPRFRSHTRSFAHSVPQMLRLAFLQAMLTAHTHSDEATINMTNQSRLS